MLQFPSPFPDDGRPPLARRSNSLNATQHIKDVSPSDMTPFLQKVQDELHDARRVQAHGQEDDLKMALNMLIDRVSDMSSKLSEAYRTQADLEVQLNVTNSNLKLIISNNEMLEEALKQNGTVGWRRGGGSGASRNSSDSAAASRPYSADFAATVPSSSTSSSQQAPQTLGTPTTESMPDSRSPTPSPSALSTTPVPDSRFFTRFRFSSRPSTPIFGAPALTTGTANGIPPLHRSSTSPLPSPTTQANLTGQKIEELTAELEKERAATKKVMQEKTDLEAELESLSQALFEEANKMVAQERIKLAATAEELEQERLQKEALKSALRVIEGENQALRGSSVSLPPSRKPSDGSRVEGETSSFEIGPDVITPAEFEPARSRSSSNDAVKSIPSSSRSSSRSSRPHAPPEPIIVTPAMIPEPVLSSSPPDQGGVATPSPPKALDHSELLDSRQWTASPLSGEISSRPSDPHRFVPEPPPVSSDEPTILQSGTSPATTTDLSEIYTSNATPSPWSAGDSTPDTSTSPRVALAI